MLFNSPAFLFLFLPLTLCGFFLAARYWGRNAAVATLIGAALIFYGNWEWKDLLILLPSVGLNFVVSQRIALLARSGRGGAAKAILIVAIVANLLILGYFKYFSLVASIVYPGSPPVDSPTSHIPLGISFFTFTQITYLVDCYRRLASREKFLNYVLFVTFFPHLISGPILHHSQIIPQFERGYVYRFSSYAFLDGLSLVILGLSKKVILADSLAYFASMSFNGAASQEITFFAAWGGALCYTLQLYFDFSGYSDMAVGMSRMMRVDLPINFNSPYRAGNIIDFWRRWHITLSNFLRDYVYIPLGGGRVPQWMKLRNLFLTMLVGGLWHGGAWTFVIWGAFHGALLVGNHLYRSACERVGFAPRGRVYGAVAWTLTFFAVVLGWVMFRASNVATAVNLYRGMFGLQGFDLPSAVTSFSPALQKYVGTAGKVPMLADQTLMGLFTMAVLIGVGMILAFFFKNLYQQSVRRRILTAGLLMPFCIQAVIFARQPSEFLYFQF